MPGAGPALDHGGDAVELRRVKIGAELLELQA